MWFSQVLTTVWQKLNNPVLRKDLTLYSEWQAYPDYLYKHLYKHFMHTSLALDKVEATSTYIHIQQVVVPSLVVEFLSYVNLHFHFTLMQKFKFWYQLEDNSVRNTFGPSVQRSFHLGGQGAPRGRDPTVLTEIAVFPEPIMLVEQMLALKMRNW